MNHAISALKFKIIREFLELGWNVLLSDVDVILVQVQPLHLNPTANCCACPVPPCIVLSHTSSGSEGGGVLPTHYSGRSLAEAVQHGTAPPPRAPLLFEPCF